MRNLWSFYVEDQLQSDFLCFRYCSYSSVVTQTESGACVPSAMMPAPDSTFMNCFFVHCLMSGLALLIFSISVSILTSLCAFCLYLSQSNCKFQNNVVCSVAVLVIES